MLRGATLLLVTLLLLPTASTSIAAIDTDSCTSKTNVYSYVNAPVPLGGVDTGGIACGLWSGGPDTRFIVPGTNRIFVESYIPYAGPTVILKLSGISVFPEVVEMVRVSTEADLLPPESPIRVITGFNGYASEIIYVDPLSVGTLTVEVFDVAGTLLDSTQYRTMTNDDLRDGCPTERRLFLSYTNSATPLSTLGGDTEPCPWAQTGTPNLIGPWADHVRVSFTSDSHEPVRFRLEGLGFASEEVAAQWDGVSHFTTWIPLPRSALGDDAVTVTALSVDGTVLEQRVYPTLMRLAS